MKQKNILTLPSIFAFLFLSLTLASAASLSIQNIVGDVQNVNHDDGSFDITFELINSGAEADIDWNSSTATQDAAFSFSHNHIRQDETIDVTATISYDAYKSGKIEGTIVADPSGAGSNEEFDFTATILESKGLQITIINPLTQTDNATMEIKNTGNVPLTNIELTSDNKDFEVKFSKTGFNLNKAETETIEVSSDDLDNLQVGLNTATIKAQASDGTKAERTLSISGSFCKLGEVGDKLGIIYIKDRKADNADEWKWRPLDNIEIDVKVENKVDEDLDVVVKLILVDSEGKEVDFVDDTDDLEQDVEINGEDTDTVTFNFQIDSDVDAGSNYKLYAKVYEDGKEGEQCAVLQAEDEDTIEEIKIEKSKHDVVVKEVDGLDIVKCGSTVELTAKVFNLGKEDEDRVRVTLYNKELGLRLTKETDDLIEGDSSTVTFSFDIPENTEEAIYSLRFSTEFSYDEDDDVYDKVSQDEDDFKYSLEVLGECEVQVNPTITATLVSSAQVGEEMIIQVSITNPGAETDFIVTADGYESWADLVSIEPSVLTIGKSNTKQLTMTFKPTQGGAHSFTIKAVYDGETAEQPVSVTIEEKTGFLTGAFGGLGNAGLYVIAGVFLILIILIIILIVKVAASGHPAEF